MTNQRLQTLLDRAEISDVFHRYAISLDTKNWEQLRTCFTDDLTADFTSLGPDLLVTGADEWVASIVSALTGMEATQHIITNHTHDIDGDTAQCTAYVHAQHVFKNDLGDSHNLLAGYYNFDMVRTPDGWKIKFYSVTITWGTGNAGLFQLAAEHLKAEAAAE